MSSLFAAAERALRICDPIEKVEATREFAADWRAGRYRQEPLALLIDAELVAGRPLAPVLVPPEQVSWRGVATPEAQGALLHALAHIEFSAINLALDAVYRFQHMPQAYYDGWVQIAWEEAEHFAALAQRLQSKGFAYGDFPAHQGLWDMAVKTADDPMARMALVPRCMEARGLDAVPPILDKLRGVGDLPSFRVLEEILNDEIRHVAEGDRWFRHLCNELAVEPEHTYRELLNQRGAPWPRGKMNISARRQAGFSENELQYLQAAASLPLKSRTAD